MCSMDHLEFAFLCFSAVTRSAIVPRTICMEFINYRFFHFGSILTRDSSPSESSEKVHIKKELLGLDTRVKIDSM